jgi:hypothetical protein
VVVQCRVKAKALVRRVVREDDDDIRARGLTDNERRRANYCRKGDKRKKSARKPSHRPAWNDALIHAA